MPYSTGEYSVSFQRPSFGFHNHNSNGGKQKSVALLVMDFEV